MDTQNTSVVVHPNKEAVSADLEVAAEGASSHMTMEDSYLKELAVSVKDLQLSVFYF